MSAKTGQGVEDIFIEVARVIMNNSKLDTLVPKRPMNFSARGTSLDPEKAEQPKKKSGCC